MRITHVYCPQNTRMWGKLFSCDSNRKKLTYFTSLRRSRTNTSKYWTKIPKHSLSRQKYMWLTLVFCPQNTRMWCTWFSCDLNRKKSDLFYVFTPKSHKYLYVPNKNTKTQFLRTEMYVNYTCSLSLKYTYVGEVVFLRFKSQEKWPNPISICA